jgi:predicted O-methyltransferase YrrM
MSRYNYFDTLFREIRPITIMEIGTCRGQGAEVLIRTALKYRDQIEYYGFDLFDTPPRHDTVSMMPDSQEAVGRRLGNMVRQEYPDKSAVVCLYKGDSRETLPAYRSVVPVADIIFIDGGHSKETVRADWDNAQAYKHDQTVFVLDDYWHDVWGKPHGGVKDVLDDLRTTYHDTLRVKIIEPGDVIHRSRHRELVGRRVHFVEARWR